MLEAVLNNLTSGVLVVDQDLNIRFSNHWINEASNPNRQSLKGMHLLAVYPQIRGTRLLLAVQQALESSLPSLLSAGLNRRPLPLYKWYSQPEAIDQLVRVIPIECGEQNCCMIEINDVSSMVKRDNLLSAQTKKLTSLASTDELTGIANRREFNVLLDRDLRHAKLCNEPLSLVFIDIDFFKAYNDALGHQAGDMCLKHVADSLRDRVRKTSYKLARYGGEEFCIVMPDTQLVDAVGVAEEIRKMIEGLALNHPKSHVSKQVTISLGVAALDIVANESASGLILKADSALYRAKRGGRNCVYVYQSIGKILPAAF